MKVNISEAAEIGLRLLGEDDRRRVMAWIDYLARWDTDSIARQHAKKLKTDNEYMLVTNTEYRIFFALEKDTITVLDLATRSTLLKFRETAEAGD